MCGFTRLRFVVSTLLLFCLVDLTTSDPCPGIHNGCNSYGFFEGYKALFTPACNEHDACYFCGSSYNLTRDNCDDIFQHDMNQICKGNGKLGCFTNAYLFYTVTSWFGSSYYTDNSHLYPICKKGCVKKALFRSHKHKHPKID